ncbi:hypothetical protein T10_3586 [Trichinella papuae]|uniref:Uncharacterized protein n=1 Tax=Trichinella papuae TaxID=268474 RepID=A0A0V1NBL6_9BILA|nr:hypothetical protein T10_3586 [Trichinella papuae]
MYLNSYCIIFVAFATINFTTSMIPPGASTPLGQTVQYDNADLRARRNVKEALFEWDKNQPFGYFKKLLEIKKGSTQGISTFFDVEVELTSCPANDSQFPTHVQMNENCFGDGIPIPCTVEYLYFDPKQVTVKCAQKPSVPAVHAAPAVSQTVKIPVVKASTTRKEVTIETQNTITKILFEWDKQHASGVFHKLLKVEGAQTVGIITTYDITLVKTSCKVQTTHFQKYADVNDSCKVVSSPVKCKVHFVNNDSRQAKIIC